MTCPRLWTVTYSFMQMKHVSNSNMKMWKNWRSVDLNFSNLCDWFINNKWSIHLAKDKTKSILFGTKLNTKRAEPLNIVCGNDKFKQCTKVTYLDCILDEYINVNPRLRFLYSQKRFLNKSLQGLLCNTMIQPFIE